jgi:hypothetical protein
MRRLDQHVTRIGNRQKPARPETGDEIGRHVDVRAGHEAKRNTVLVENVLKFADRFANRRAGIVVEAGQDMGRTGNNCDSLSHGRFRHGQ